MVIRVYALISNAEESETERFYEDLWASLVARTVNRLSAMLETRVQSLGWEDPLEQEMTTHSSTLAWKTPWTQEPVRLQSVGLQRLGHD